MLTLCVDPGETTGWAIFKGPLLVAAGQTPMWEFADEVYDYFDGGNVLFAKKSVYIREGMEDHLNDKITNIVCEDWRLYPDKLKSLAWDQCRTARLIGALTLVTRVFRLGWYLQPAAIKNAAVTAGAEELFYRPLHENRHQNDAIMHGVYFSVFGPDGDPRVPNNVS